MADPQNKQRYYPVVSDFPSHEQWNAHVQTLNQIYSLHDRMDAMEAKGKAGTQEKPPEFPNGASNTKIAGLNVAGSPTANAQKLTYNSKTGQLEWQ